MSNDDLAPLDLGRPLTRADIVRSDEVWPLDVQDEGRVHCNLCMRETRCEAPPLTRSTGVFTSLVTCEQGQPLWVCLEHVPFRSREFEAFTPEVQAALRALRAARRH